jgi:hypothetical protein
MTQAAILAASGSPGTTTGFKNKFINGDMRVAQRGTGAVSAHADFPVDRWQILEQMTSGVFSAQQSSDVPNGTFTNSLLLTVTTAQTSIPNTYDYASFRQKIEGYNIQGLGLGTSAATSFTLSFWVKASQTGTWCIQLTNNDTQYYVAPYTITTANTWQQITINIPPNISGSWNKTNSIGLQVWWTLACGTDYQTATPNTWVTIGSSLMKTSAQNNFFATLGNTFYITGVQIEVGTTATNFDFRDYGTEFNLCLRYFWQCNDSIGQSYASNNVTRTPVSFLVPMRTAPTLASGATFTPGTGSAGSPGLFYGTGVPSSGTSGWIYNTSANWSVGTPIQLTGGFNAEL